MKRFMSLAIALIALSSPVLAVNEIILTIDTGPNTSQIKTVAQEVRYPQSPRELAAGQASRGKTKFNPFTITRKVDSASPFFRKAAINGRPLPSVLFEFTRTINGQQQVYQRVKLTNVIISADKMISEGSNPTEEISFTFEKIEYEHMQGRAAATDSWKP
jgi:type VI secretion system Hcp family effector